MSEQITIPSGNVSDSIETFSFGNGGTGVRFDVAVNKMLRGEEVTNWYKITCFGRMADIAQEKMAEGKLAKGARVVVVGSFSPRGYVTKNGENRTSLDVVAHHFEITYSPRAESSQQYSQQEDEMPYVDDDQPDF